MQNKLYVGNLPYSVSEEQLNAHFGGAGEVLSAKIIKDKFTGESKGFGFVEMSTDDQAQEAISTLDGSSLGGRSIRVSLAREREANDRGGGGGGGDRRPFRGNNESRGGFRR